MPTKNEAFDDWSPELPALDGDEEEEATTSELDDELTAFEDESGVDPFDDAVAGDSLDGTSDFDDLIVDETTTTASDDDETEIDIGDVGITDFDDGGGLAADSEEWEGDDDFADLEEAFTCAPDDSTRARRRSTSRFPSSMRTRTTSSARGCSWTTRTPRSSRTRPCPRGRM